LKLLQVSENKGAANALSLGFKASTGDYVCWLSADDAYINRMKINKQVTLMEKCGAYWSFFRDSYTGPDIVHSSLVRGSFLPRLTILNSLFVSDPDLLLMILFFRNPINGSSIMIKRECVDRYGQFDPITRNVDLDGDLWMRYSAIGLKPLSLNSVAVFYRVHQAQTSKNRQVMTYGSELTRMRILIALANVGGLTRLIKKFAPFLVALIGSRSYLERPFTSEFLFTYIRNHSEEFDWFLTRKARVSLERLRTHENYLNLDKDGFLKSLELFAKTPTFGEFEKMLKNKPKLEN
jgi:glycosyltransferase involved in cell wall biosynthesis